MTTPKPNPVIEGLNILHRYYPEAEISADHELIYYAPYEPDRLSPEDLAKLRKYDWLEAEEFECWMTYV